MADERIDGYYTFTNGVVAAISRLAGGPSTAERHDVPNGWVCPDGPQRV